MKSKSAPFFSPRACVWSIGAILVLACAVVCGCAEGQGESSLGSEAQLEYEVVYKWPFMDFQFPSKEARQRALDKGSYIPLNNTLTGLKVFKNDIYVTISRWAAGVPSTLNLVDPETSLLVPWPSWDMQTVGDCDKFQFVQSMEIDPSTGHMWVIDTGAATGFDYGPSPCPAKLVVVDTATGLVVRRHEFPTSVVPPTNFLNDIVLDLDDAENAFAYISDVFVPGIVVYDAANDRSWRAYHPTMENEPGAEVVEIPGYPVVLPEPNIDGIALSPRNNTRTRRVYYCPLAGFNLYSVDTAILRDEATATDEAAVSTVVRHEGRKSSQSDGLAMSADGFLYFGLLGNVSVAAWNASSGAGDDADGEPGTQEEFESNVGTVMSGAGDFEWPDTFSIDGGYLYVTTNRLNRFFSGTLDITSGEDNYKIIRAYIGAGSYLET